MTSNGNPFKYVINEDNDPKDILTDTVLKEIENDGHSMFKVRGGRRCYQRLYKLDIDNKRILYEPTQKIQIACLKTPPFINLVNALEVRKGWKTDKFNAIETEVRQRWHANKPYPRAVKEENCFSIIFPTKSKTVDLIAPTKDVRNVWFHAIKQVINEAKENANKSASELFEDEELLRKAFHKFDYDKKGSLDINQVSQFLESINISVSDTHLNEVFNEADVIKGRKEKKKESRLNFDEFKSFIDNLTTRKDILELFQKYSKQGSMKEKELQKFYNEEQKEEKSVEEVKELISKFGSSKVMTLKGFQRLLLNANLFDERHKEVNQDMSQPLSHYFTASSHNTYLLGNQLNSTSSIEAYVRVLKAGCRCVELDMWDGDDDEPIIYHGYTLTSKILLRDVLEAIYDNAFETSKYPIILSLENHLSIEQQKVAAHYFTGLLGDMLLTAPLSEDETTWPSPEQLAYKIILKGKKLTPGGDTVDGPSRKTSTATTPGGESDIAMYTGDPREIFKLQMPPKKFHSNPRDYSDFHGTLTEEDEDDDDTDQDDVNIFATEVDLVDDHCEPDKRKTERSPSDYSERSVYVTALPPPDDAKVDARDVFPEKEDKTETPKDDTPKVETEDEPQGAVGGVSTPMTPPSATIVKTPAKTQLKLAQELSDVTIYCQARHFKSFETSKEWKFFEMSSFEERKGAELAANDRAPFINYNLKNMSRIYPKGTRTNSSNYKPTLYWSAGCQMIALNYQTKDKSMRTNNALFEMNGRCGYVLKPNFLRVQHETDAKNIGIKAEFLKVTIISGQTLGRRVTKEQVVEEPLSPNEPVSPISSASPTSLASHDIPDPFVSIKVFGDPNEKQKFKTKYVKNNVFNPNWNQEFEFEIKSFELGFIQFTVKNYANSEKLGEALLPLAAIKEGYGHVNLNDETGSGIPHSSIFVKVERITDINDVIMKRLKNVTG